MDKFFKERSNQYLILGATIVFAVVALGACGYIAYEKNTPKKQKTVSQNTSSSLTCREDEEMTLGQCASKLHALGYTIIPPSDGKEDTKKEEEKEEDSGVIDYEADIIDTQPELVAEAKLKPEERIDKILAKAKQIMDKYSDGEGKVVGKNDLVVSVLLKNGIYSSSKKQKGVALRFVSNNGEYKSLQWRNQYDWGIKGIFERRGFMNQQETFSYVDMYENGEAITCKSSFMGQKEGNEEAHYYYVSCTLNTWYPKEDYELLAALTDAVRRATGSKISGINYTAKNIENSPKSPYQRIAGTSMFYRTSPKSEWKYFRSAVHVIPCSKFNTDELKNAFYGVGCSKGEEIIADGKVGID